MKRKAFTIFLCVTLLFSWKLCAGSYQPDFDVQEFIEKTTDVKITQSGKTYIFEPVFQDEDEQKQEEQTAEKTALIFYPGGKVSYESYIPLLTEIARKGILCVMPKMHHDLAIYNENAASIILKDETFADVEKWYIGGHSLGGAIAAMWAKRNPDKIKGVVFLAAYSTKNLSDTDLKVISIYGSNDGVLNKETYERDKKNLPVDFDEYVIPGGNHCGFGNYGFQKGDNSAEIDSEEQKKLAAEYLSLHMININ